MDIDVMIESLKQREIPTELQVTSTLEMFPAYAYREHQGRALCETFHMNIVWAIIRSKVRVKNYIKDTAIGLMTAQM
jgi:hypothetical protein